MIKKTVRIWIWIFNEKLFKAICCEQDGTVSIYDDTDTLLIKRSGLTPAFIRVIEISLSCSGAKRIDNKEEPFTYL